MILQVEFTWLVGVLVMFVLAVWALGKVLMGQFEKRLDERFVSQERKASVRPSGAAAGWSNGR